MNPKINSNEMVAVAAALCAFSKAIDASGSVTKRTVALMWQAAEIANIPPETRAAVISLANCIEQGTL